MAFEIVKTYIGMFLDKEDVRIVASYKPNAHLYDVYVEAGGRHGVIEVRASNRSSAAIAAERNGFVVGSVNMVG